MPQINTMSSTKIKLEQFFLEWLLSEGDALIENLTDDFKKLDASFTPSGKGEPIEKENTSSKDILTPNKQAPPAVSFDLPQSPSTSGKTLSLSNATLFARSPKKRTQSEMMLSPEHQDSIGYISTNSSTKSQYIASDDREALDALAEEDGDESNLVSSNRRRANFDVIPKFYFRSSTGRSTISNRNVEDRLSYRLADIEAYFKPHPNGIPAEKFVHITKKLIGTLLLI